MAFHGLLLSSGFNSEAVREKVAAEAYKRKYTKAQIVTTARPEKERAPWCAVTKQQLEAMGMTVTYIDFDVGESIDDTTDVVYVCGGNTFHLLYSIQQSENPIRQQVEDLCARGGLYIGSSAGALIVAPSIVAATEIGGDRNRERIDDYQSLGCIAQHVIPHYTPSMDTEVMAFREKHGLLAKDVLLIRDGEGVYLDGGQQTRIPS